MQGGGSVGGKGMAGCAAEARAAAVLAEAARSRRAWCLVKGLVEHS